MSGPLASAATNGVQAMPVLEGVAGEREGQRRDLLADPGPAALLGEDAAAVLGVLAAERVEGQHGHHVADRRGRHDHLVAAGLQRDLRRRPVEPAPDLLLHPLERGRDGRFADPGRPVPSAVRPTRLTAPVGCAWESRSPVELPRYSVTRSSSAKPASTASRARARPKAPDSAAEHALERAGVGLPPARARSHAPGGRPTASTRGKASSAGGAPRASASAAAAMSATPSAPTTPDCAAPSRPTCPRARSR